MTWPDPMSKPPNQPASKSTPEPGAPDLILPADDIRAGACLDGLAALEASLRFTQKALLARDLHGIAQGARDQRHFQQQLELLLFASRAAHKTTHPAWDFRHSRFLPDLNAAAHRILHLGRIQAALLERGQRSLRMLSNLLAAPSACYRPPSPDSRPLSPNQGSHP